MTIDDRLASLRAQLGIAKSRAQERGADLRLMEVEREKALARAKEAEARVACYAGALDFAALTLEGIRNTVGVHLSPCDCLQLEQCAASMRAIRERPGELRILGLTTTEVRAAVQQIKKAEAERDEAVRQRDELLGADVAREGAERQAVRLIARTVRLQEQLVGTIARAEAAEARVQELEAEGESGLFCKIRECYAKAAPGTAYCKYHRRAYEHSTQAAPEPPAEEPVTLDDVKAVSDQGARDVMIEHEDRWHPDYHPISRAEVEAIADARIADALEQLAAEQWGKDCRSNEPLHVVAKCLRDGAPGGADRG